MSKRCLFTALIMLLLLQPTMAQPVDLAQTAIRAALAKWTADFNAARVTEVCDLFSADLRYEFAGFPERGHRELCEQLRTSLSDRSKRYTYSHVIKEIIVSGDLAVVRLTWTLKVRTLGEGDEAVTEEPGMDIFRRQLDGRWKIIRYIAYEAQR
jgi:steroid delta-isomerase